MGTPSTYERRLRDLLDRVASGDVAASSAIAEIRDLPFADLGFAKVDHHRELRQGRCEIVYAEGKLPAEVGGIVSALLERNVGPVLVTRADAEHVEAVRAAARDADGLETIERPRARAVAIARNVPEPRGCVLVVTAGTSDLPVAEEAELTARVLGAGTEIVADVGVAGLHRIEAARPALAEADAVVVVAGMEGALASVIGGLADVPVIACPTSVGYGATFGGLAALLAMLVSCAPGVACVNVDDGVGAGWIASMIARASAGVRP